MVIGAYEWELSPMKWDDEVEIPPDARFCWDHESSGGESERYGRGGVEVRGDSAEELFGKG